MKGDMTQGSPSKLLINYTIPLVCGNIFQQLYNATDAMIVGKFIGKDALAAVGVSNPIMSVALFFIIGACIGISVLLSQLFGQGDYKALKREMSTGLIVGTFLTLFLSVACIALSRGVLIKTGTPSEILHDADTFLKIIFGGLVCSFLYNYYSSALRAIGDSKTPLVFLILSCLANGVLCFLFVVIFKMGVAGSAIATVIAQALSSALCVIYVHKKIPLISLKRNELVVDRSLLKITIKYSWVNALQQTCLFLGMLLIQGAVNPLGISAIAAYNSVLRVDSFILAPRDSLSNAVAIFSAQNKGNGKLDRIIDGYKKGTQLITVYCIVIAIVVFVSAVNIMHFFVSSTETEVIQIGARYLKVISLFYVLSGFCNIFQGLFRGVGMLRVTFIATILQMFARVSLSYKLAPYLSITSVCYATAVGWVLMIIYEGNVSRKLFRQITEVHNMKINEWNSDAIT